MRLAFVTAASSPVLPPPRDDLAKHLAAVEDQLPSIEPSAGPFKVPRGMEVRTYNLSIRFLNLWLTSDPGPSKSMDPFAPVDPFAPSSPYNDRNDQWEDMIRRTAKVGAPKELLIAQGITFPPGSWVVYHQPSNQLVVAHDPASHELIHGFFDSLMVHRSGNTVVTLHLVEGAEETLRALEKEATAPDSDEVVWTRAQKLITEGRLKRIGLLRASGNNRSIFNLAAGPEQVTASPLMAGPGDYQPDGGQPVDGLVHLDLDEEILGTRLKAEFEPEPDAFTFNSKIDLWQGFPTRPGAKPRFHHLETTPVVKRGVPKLIGIWPRDEAPPGKDRGNILQAAILKMEEVPVPP